MIYDLIKKVETALANPDEKVVFPYKTDDQNGPERVDATRSIWLWKTLSMHLSQMPEGLQQERFTRSGLADYPQTTILLCCPQMAHVAQKLKVAMQIHSNWHCAFNSLGMVLLVDDGEPIGTFTSTVEIISDTERLETVSVRFNPTLRVDKVLGIQDPMQMMEELWAADKREVSENIDETTLVQLKDKLQVATGMFMPDYMFNSVILLVKEALEKKTTVTS